MEGRKEKKFLEEEVIKKGFKKKFFCRIGFPFSWKRGFFERGRDWEGVCCREFK